VYASGRKKAIKPDFFQGLLHKHCGGLVYLGGFVSLPRDSRYKELRSIRDFYAKAPEIVTAQTGLSSKQKLNATLL